MSRGAYERKLARLSTLAEGLGSTRAGQLTMLAADPHHPTHPVETAAEREFLELMAATLDDAAAERARFGLG